MAKTIFDAKRFYKFIVRQASFNVQPLLIAIGGIFGILLMISVVTAYFNPGNIGNMIPLYLVVFFIAGFIFTSKVFDELNNQQRSYSFLTLPVSNFEKALGSWLLTSPVYAVIYLVIVSIIFFISSSIAGRPFQFLELWNEGTFRAIGTYMVIQTIFFLGACTFRNYNFLKTLLSLFIIAVGLTAYSTILVVILFHGNFNSGEVRFDSSTSGIVFEKIIPFIFIYMLAPFLLIVSYYKLKERQI